MCGYSGLVHTMLKDVDVRLNSVVTSIQSSDDETMVRVTTDDGIVHEGSQVVVTAPLGVLKQGNITFEPPLPRGISDSISRLGMGTLGFLYLEFSEPFWPEEQPYEYYHVPPTGEDHPTRLILNISPWVPDGYNPSVMVSFNTDFYLTEQKNWDGTNWNNGSSGSTFDEEMYELYVQPVLSAVFPGNDAVFAAPLRATFSVPSWTTPFVGGVYSALKPYSSPEDYAEFQSPVANGRVFFAGEHTHPVAFQSTTGAYVSGIRAARDVLDLNVRQLMMNATAATNNVTAMDGAYYQNVTLGLNEWEWECGPPAALLDDDYFFNVTDATDFFPYGDDEICNSGDRRRRRLRLAPNPEFGTHGTTKKKFQQALGSGSFRNQHLRHLRRKWRR